MSMSPISKALFEIRQEIPMPVLEAAFLQRRFSALAPLMDVDEGIRQHVIDARVLVDCNLTGGTQVIIPLLGLPIDRWETSTMVIRVPKDRTQNRRITRVTSVMFGIQMIPGHQTYGLYNQSDYMGAGAQVYSSHASIPIQSTANVSLIAENTVMILDQIMVPGSMQLLCYLENDLDMSQMGSMTISKFSHLCTLATKAYIYKELTIKMAEGFLTGGLELGRFKEIVDGYADANELYRTYLNDIWIKVQMMDDHNSKHRFMRLMLGNH